MIGNLKSTLTVSAFTKHNALELSFAWHERRIPGHMTPDEARHLVIEGINYAAYHETDFSLYDSDKNRLFGSKHYGVRGEYSQTELRHPINSRSARSPGIVLMARQRSPRIS